MNQFKATLLGRQQVSADVYLLSFYSDELSFSFVPGQYAILTIPGQTSLKRLYSFASAPSTYGGFELFVKIVEGGVGTQYLKTLHIGDCVDVSGPAGLFTLQKNEKRKIFMATGTGYAPMRSFFLSSSPASLKNSVLFWGMKTIEETCLLNELYSLNKDRGLSFYYCLSQQDLPGSIPAHLLQHYRTGHIQDVWKSVIGKPDTADEYYLCGSRVVVESLRTLLGSLNVDKENIFFEKY